MPHPKLEYIFRIGTLCPSADMAVHIYKAGEQIHAFRLDFLATRFELGPALRVNRYTRVSYVAHLLDHIVLHHHVHGADGWGTVPIDQGRPADDQLRIGAVPLFAVGCLLYLSAQSNGNECQQE